MHKINVYRACQIKYSWVRPKMKMTNFQIIPNKSKSKCNLSSTSNGSSTETSKKNNSMFASSNRFVVLEKEYENVGIVNIEQKQIGINSDIENKQIKIKPTLPIFVHGILDYPALRTHLTKLIRANNLVVKSTINNLKI